MELWQLDVCESLSGYRSGQFTPVDMLDSILKRISAVNPKLNAIVTENYDAAKELAAHSTKRWQANSPVGGLDGVFITVKDNIPVQGLRCTWGSKTYEDFVPKRDESPVEHLCAAGVGILGKTNTPEFTLQGFTDNLVFGATGNPWNPNLTPGGSSGGAVAAVASGMGAVAIGTDGGGSIRRPCAHTGLYGLKPSPGFVGRSNGLPALLQDFETMGVMARSPGDIRLVLVEMAHRHPADRSSYAFSEEERLHETASPEKLRILYVPIFDGFPVDPEIRASLDGAARLLENMGHIVEEGTEPFDVEELNAIWGLIGPVGLTWLVESQKLDPSQMTSSLFGMLETGRQAGATVYLDLLKKVESFRASFVDLFQRYDVVMTPSVAALPWPKKESHPDFIDGQSAGPRGHAVFTPFANAGGLPGINVPTAPSASGLPIGAQLVGPFGSDLMLLALAKSYASEFGGYEFPVL